MKALVQENGIYKEINANYSVYLDGDRINIIFDSNGGNKKTGQKMRNPDYTKGNQVVLDRLGALNAVMKAVYIAAEIKREPTDEERRLKLSAQYKLPCLIRDLGDIKEFRIEVGRKLAAFDHDDKGKGGNNTKRVRYEVSCQQLDGLAIDEIERILAGISPVPAGTEKPTSDPVELQARADEAVKRLAHQEGCGLTLTPPAGQARPPKTTSSSERYQRDPEVVAWAAKEAKGVCQVCGSPAPFLRENGQPYLEVHHILPLSQGGADMVENAIACCPNCHSAFHHSENKDGLRDEYLRWNAEGRPERKTSGGA
jgi:5-methylcytosine-specific restriction protein A